MCIKKEEEIMVVLPSLKINKLYQLKKILMRKIIHKC